jgi:hypothetical protein
MVVRNDEFKAKACLYYAYFNQGEIWVARGSGPIRIKEDMDYRWRVNAANYMIKFAFHYQMYYSFGEIYYMSEPLFSETVHVVDGELVLSGAKFSQLDLMGDHAMDGYEESQDWARDNPKEWMRTTTLYKAMIHGLPQDALELLI